MNFFLIAIFNIYIFACKENNTETFYPKTPVIKPSNNTPPLPPPYSLPIPISSLPPSYPLSTSMLV